MIDEVLVMLKDKLNAYFRLKADVQEDKVAFVDGSKTDPLSIPLNNVVPLLMNIEEEKALRPANRYEGLVIDGLQTRSYPALTLNILVLFVCKFSDYQQSLKFLSLVLAFFQRNPVFDPYNTPTLSAGVERLRIEFISLPIAQQNELWSSLRSTYLPSALYKLSLLVYDDKESIFATGETKQIDLTLSNATV